jgi:hypothetical protein
MDTKKLGRTAKTEVRAASARMSERSPAPSKRPSAPPPLASAKKRDKSVPPPAAPVIARASSAPIAPGSAPGSAPGGAVPRTSSAPAPGVPHAVANDNDRAKKVGVPPLGRGRLPTGSLHTEAREPAHADKIKQQLTALVNVQQKLGEMKRAANRNFYEIGALLHRVRSERLYEVKGYSSFEAFVERETNLGQQFCAQVVRIHQTFLPEAAHTLGFSRLSAALAVLDDEPSGMTAVDSLRGSRPAIPPHKL